MTDKKLPFTKTQIEKIIEKYPTPFHIYDARAIREKNEAVLYFCRQQCSSPDIS